MSSYLEIALRVASRIQSVGSETTAGIPELAESVTKKPCSETPKDTAAQSAYNSNELAPCGSPDCGGCYEVGDGRKIHPPKCGQDFLRWRAWLEGKGSRQ
jgi:hypothetical protein